MGFLSSLFGLNQGAKDDLDAANQIWNRAHAEGRELTAKEVKQIEKLMDMRQEKLDRIDDQRGGLGW